MSKLDFLNTFSMTCQAHGSWRSANLHCLGDHLDDGIFACAVGSCHQERKQIL